MNLPMFSPDDSPGPSFSELLRRVGHDPAQRLRDAAGVPVAADQIPHGTTILVMRYDQGVLMAADRRSTMGHAIAGRDIEKVHQADRHSGISISGSAGFGLEMIKVFQLNLEHYEKVEGNPLSMEGKANQLSGMIRANFGMAMQGLAVIPLFAGYDLSRDRGRIFSYDVTGGMHEEPDFDATGSGGRDARTTIKLGWREGMSKVDATELAVQALYEAADEDSATGGPDVVRGIYPIVVTITAAGYERLSDDEVAERFNSLIARKTEAGHRP
jgi:proteasome beta subunit